MYHLYRRTACIQEMIYLNKNLLLYFFCDRHRPGLTYWHGYIKLLICRVNPNFFWKSDKVFHWPVVRSAESRSRYSTLASASPSVSVFTWVRFWPDRPILLITLLALFISRKKVFHWSVVSSACSRSRFSTLASHPSPKSTDNPMSVSRAGASRIFGGWWATTSPIRK